MRKPCPLPQRAYTVGIDPASESFVAALLTSLEDDMRAIEAFENTKAGFIAFQGWLEHQGATPEETVICVENTGVYSEALCYSLYEQGFLLALAVPFKVYKASEEGPKTDRRDSQKIAEYALRYRDRLTAWVPQEALAERVKAILATREQLIRQKTATQNTLHAMRRKVVETPSVLRALETIKASLAEQIEALMEDLKRLIGEQPRVAQMVELVRTAPGVGLLMASHLLVLTKAFTERPSYRVLAAHLGICPNEYASGKRVWRPSKGRGYGPSMMRKLLYLASGSVVAHYEQFGHYYARKCAEGKSKLLVRNNVANKLLRIICAMLRNEEPYIETYRSIHPRLLKTP
jgi:transposase